MIAFFRRNKEPNKKVRIVEIGALCALVIASIIAYVFGTIEVNSDVGRVTYIGETTMMMDETECDFEEYSVCEVSYSSDEGSLTITYTEDEYTALDKESITAYIYETEDGRSLYFDHQDVLDNEIKTSYSEMMADEMMSVFNFANASIILAISVAVMLGFGKQFSTYEKCLFLSIMVLATIFSVLFPEESANGVNGIIIMWLYLLDTFLNILCELLISKQSRYNFLVSVLVEITEIAISIVLMYRFATLATTLFFWLPIDIISFVNWSRHKDTDEDELTIVRRLKGWQEVLVIALIVIWTFAVGYLISGLDIATDFYNDQSLETAIIYIDACASAVGIANGLFIFFRFREQWIAWYICSALEAIINILSGQYVLLILKLGYFTNTTYGYIKWTKYIKEHKEEKKLSIF